GVSGRRLSTPPFPPFATVARVARSLLAGLRPARTVRGTRSVPRYSQNVDQKPSSPPRFRSGVPRPARSFHSLAVNRAHCVRADAAPAPRPPHTSPTDCAPRSPPARSGAHPSHGSGLRPSRAPPQSPTDLQTRFEHRPTEQTSSDWSAFSPRPHRVAHAFRHTTRTHERRPGRTRPRCRRDQRERRAQGRRVRRPTLLSTCRSPCAASETSLDGRRTLSRLELYRVLADYRDRGPRRVRPERHGRGIPRRSTRRSRYRTGPRGRALTESFQSPGRAITPHATGPPRRLVTLRRDLHRHPEPAWREFYTTSRIVDECERIGVDELFVGPEVLADGERTAVPDDDELDEWYESARAAGAREDVLEELKGGYTGAVAVLERGE